MVLEAVYEQDFLPCSYGFRPGRAAHQALQALRTAIMSQRLRWVLDIDIVKYFEVAESRSPGRWPPAPRDRRLPPRRRDLTLPLEHFSTPRAG